MVPTNFIAKEVLKSTRELGKDILPWQQQVAPGISITSTSHYFLGTCGLWPLPVPFRLALWRNWSFKKKKLNIVYQLGFDCKTLKKSIIWSTKNKHKNSNTFIRNIVLIKTIGTTLCLKHKEKTPIPLGFIFYFSPQKWLLIKF